MTTTIKLHLTSYIGNVINWQVEAGRGKLDQALKTVAILQVAGYPISNKEYRMMKFFLPL
ncbi:hypothetical protein ACFL03_05640 [Thermodesulfobacteriota bacterium]